MLAEFLNVWDGHIGWINVAKNRIEILEDTAKLVRPAPYRMRPKRKEFGKVEIDKMLAQEIIELAQTDKASRIVLVPKKDDKLRFCVACRRPNVFSNENRTQYQEWMNSLTLSAKPNTIDTSSGYWQVDIDERDPDKTAFPSHHGPYRLIRMRFELKMLQAPSSIQWKK